MRPDQETQLSCPICGTQKEFGCECLKNYSESFQELIATKGAKELLKGSHMETSFKDWEEGRKSIASAIDRDGTVLDVGCANGFLLRCLQEWSDQELTPYGIDVNEDSLKDARALFPDQAEDRFPLADDEAAAKKFPKAFDFIFWNVWDNADFDQQSTSQILSQCVKKSVEGGGRLILGFYHPDPQENQRKMQQLREKGFELHEMESDQNRDERFVYIEREEIKE